TWYDTVRGMRLRDAVRQAHGNFALVGASQDARAAVLARTQGKSTTFAILTPQRERIVKLGGNRWQFDALSGDRLFLIHYVGRGWDAASTYALGVDPDGRHLWALSPGYRRVTHIDVQAHRVVDAYSFHVDSWNSNTVLATMSPDGERIAFTDAYHIWYVELAQRKVVPGPTHVTVALGYSPDQKRLWVVGERSSVTALPVR